MSTEKKTIVLAVILLSAVVSGFACSTFMLKTGGSLVLGHNVDYNSDYMPGYIFINKRGVAKNNFTLNDLYGKTNASPGLKWTSRYGSVSFNMIAELFPTAGINEKGLFIAEMALVSTEYPTGSRVPRMIANQWMQYQLDNYRLVEEVIKNLSAIAPENDAPNHYFLSDKTGDYACIEYIHGKPAVYKGESMPVPLLCNSEYPAEMELLKNYRGFGGSRTIDTPLEGTDTRFFQGAVMLENCLSNSSKPPVEYAFEVLTNMWRGNNKWAFVIDVSRSMIYFQTSRYRQIKYFSFNDSDFAPGTPVKMFDLNSCASGDVSDQFSLYMPQLVRYSIIERLKQNPQPYDGKTIGEINAGIKRVENYLEGIKVYESKGKDTLKNSFTIKKMDPLKVAEIGDRLPPEGEGKLWIELADFLNKNKVRANGAGFTVYGTDGSVEVAVPVTEAGVSSGRIRFKTLEAVEAMASVVYKGPYSDFPSVYQALYNLLDERGYQAAGPVRSVWLRSDWEEEDPGERVTEIQIPVRKK